MLNEKTLEPIASLLYALTLDGLVVWTEDNGDFTTNAYGDTYQVTNRKSFYFNDMLVTVNSSSINDLYMKLADVYIAQPIIQKLQGACIISSLLNW